VNSNKKEECKHYYRRKSYNNIIETNPRTVVEDSTIDVTARNDIASVVVVVVATESPVRGWTDHLYYVLDDEGTISLF